MHVREKVKHTLACSGSMPPTQGLQFLLGRSFYGGSFETVAQRLQPPRGSNRSDLLGKSNLVTDNLLKSNHIILLTIQQNG